MIVASFFTPNGNYPALAQRLADSCNRFNVPSRIMKVDDTGQWLSSNNLKPSIILDALFETRQPILFCDADCELLAKPAILDDTDFGIYNWHADKECIKPEIPYNPSVLLGSGGVIYFNYTAPAIELLIRWRETLSRNPQGVDDQVLDYCFNTSRPPVKCWWMPKTMNFMTGLFGDVPEDCVIRHDFLNRLHREA
jgi:hypothetical protein